MTTKLNVGLIGLGTQIIKDHLPTLLRRSDIEVISACDPFVNAKKIIFENFPQLKGKTVIHQYLGNDFLKNLDFAVVAVPHNEYPEIVKFLCKNNVPFIKEKPLARSLAEAEQLFNLKNFEHLCFICTQRRYNDLYLKAYDLLKFLGQIFSFNAVYRLNINNPHEGWRGNQKLAGGGCILDMGYHLIDQLTWWFGTPKELFVAKSAKAIPKKKYAEDSATIAFKYSNGLHGCLSLSRFAGEKYEQYSVNASNGHLLGNKKSLLVKDKNGIVLNEYSLNDDQKMLDEQLNHFISRLKGKRGFKDIVNNHLLNMKLLDDCYKNSKSL